MQHAVRASLIEVDLEFVALGAPPLPSLCNNGFPSLRYDYPPPLQPPTYVQVGGRVSIDSLLSHPSLYATWYPPAVTRTALHAEIPAEITDPARQAARARPGHGIRRRTPPSPRPHQRRVVIQQSGIPPYPNDAKPNILFRSFHAPQPSKIPRAWNDRIKIRGLAHLSSNDTSAIHKEGLDRGSDARQSHT
jgi:hypothetical protein